MAQKMILYFAKLPWTRLVLWCYLMWYFTIVGIYFDPSVSLWISSLGISAIIGTALILSTSSANHRPDGWTIFRLYLMPLCVSSYSAIIKGKGFIMLFPPHLNENLAAAGACVAFIGWHWICKLVSSEPRMASDAH
jgi:hypothetical protein